jgi:hypothetical protein
MANLTYKQATITPPASTTTKGSLLTAQEVDSNLNSLNIDIQTRVLRAGDKLTGALEWSNIAVVASAATTNIGDATSNIVSVTGTNTITSFGTSLSGVERTVIFANALTLTHNATSLILPYGTNVTVTAGDVGTFVSLGSGNWRSVGSRDVSGLGTVDQYVKGDRTFGDFFANVRSVLLTGFSAASSSAVAATDTILIALGKLQAQILTKQDTLVSASNIKSINSISLVGSGNLQISKIDRSMPSSTSRLIGNSRYYIDGNTSSGYIFYLPSGTQGMEISFVDMYGNWNTGTWNVGYDVTGGKVMGLNENMLINRANYNFTLVYVDATAGWRII